MFIKKKFFVLLGLLILLHSNVGLTFDRAYIKKFDPSFNYHPTAFGVLADGTTNTFIRKDITYFEDGSFLVPTIPTKKRSLTEYQVNQIYYVFIDCKAPGVIIYDDKLENPTPLFNYGSPGINLKNYFCVSKTSENEKVLWIGNQPESNYKYQAYTAWFLDSTIVKNHTIKFEYSGIDHMNKKILGVLDVGRTEEIIMDCKAQTIRNKGLEKNYDDHTHNFHFLFDTLCKKNTILEVNNISFDKDYDKYCSEKGLVKGTEDYGQCILQQIN